MPIQKSRRYAFMKVEGLAETQMQLQALAGKLGWRAMSQALAASGRKMRAAAKNNAPVGSVAHRTYRGNLVAPGFTKRSITLVRFPRKNNNTALVAVGVKKSAYYAVQFVEQGHKTKNGGRVAPRPWLKKSYDQTVGAVPASFTSELRERVLKATQ